ncbi:MAG: winged helix-turn-helix transcriptional regulator [Geminicoccaceae bacterium]
MARRPLPDPYDQRCPSRAIVDLIGDKWTLLILPLLSEGPKRNGELMRRVGGISQKMLTQTLKALEQNGLLERRDYGEVPPRVDYRLTSLGRSLARLISEIDNWVVDNFHEIERAREIWAGGRDRPAR